MKNGLPAFRIFLNLMSLPFCLPNLAVGATADPLAVAAVVRKADADWAAAAGTASVGNWMSFYAADAIVLLPNEQLASGQEPVRRAVSRLLALTHLSIAWHPIDASVARSGDLAFLVEAYELRFDDSRGAPVSDRGRRLEIWRRQIDGSWKCFVDNWNLDAPVTAESAAALAQPETPVAAAPDPAPAADSGPPAPVHVAATKYGDLPTNYQEAIRKYFLEHLKHPQTVQYREITQPEQGYTTELTGGLLMREKRNYGWTVKVTINAMDSHDHYVGFKSYTFLFRGERIVDARFPLPGDEMN